MKKALIMTLLTGAFAAQTMPAFADATTAQKEQMEKATKMVSEMVKTDEGCTAMCDAMMKHEKSKKMLVEMIKKDPEAMKMLHSN